MGKRPRGGAKGGTQKVKPSEVMRMPAVSACKEIASELSDARESHSSIAEALKRAMAEKKSSQGIHPGAIKMVEAQRDKAKKSDRGLAAVATFFAHLDYYRDVLGLDKLLEEQGQMIPRTETGEPSDDIDEQPGAAAGATPEEERDLRPTHLRRPEAQGEPADGEEQPPIKH